MSPMIPTRKEPRTMVSSPAARGGQLASTHISPFVQAILGLAGIGQGPEQAADSRG
jgi:hypothetical protein